MSQVASVQRLLSGDAVCYWAAAMQDASGPEPRHGVVVGVVTSVLSQPEESAIFVVRPGDTTADGTGACASGGTSSPATIKTAIPIGAETKLRILAGAGDAASELCEVSVGERSFVYEAPRADIETLAIAFNKANKAACDSGVSVSGKAHFQWVRAQHVQSSGEPLKGADNDNGNDSDSDDNSEDPGCALTPTDAVCVERALRAEEREHCTYRTIS